MTMTITKNREKPERYKCANFDICGTSSSHDPEYVGWIKVMYRNYCSSACAEQGLMQRILRKEF